MTSTPKQLAPDDLVPGLIVISLGLVPSPTSTYLKYEFPLEQQGISLDKSNPLPLHTGYPFRIEAVNYPFLLCSIIYPKNLRESANLVGYPPFIVDARMYRLGTVGSEFMSVLNSWGTSPPKRSSTPEAKQTKEDLFEHLRNTFTDPPESTGPDGEGVTP